MSLDWRYYRYNGPMMRENFLRFINIVLNPYAELTSEADISAFQDPNKEYEERNAFYKREFVPLNYHSLLF